jgi:hypothetical protein
VDIGERIIAETHDVRNLKVSMSRGILHALDQAGISVASATFEIVGLPPWHIQVNAYERDSGNQRDKNVCPSL